MALDAFDAKTKKALWHGKITDVINPKKPDPAKADAALTKLLERFPFTKASQRQEGGSKRAALERPCRERQ